MADDETSTKLGASETPSSSQDTVHVADEETSTQLGASETPSSSRTMRQVTASVALSKVGQEAASAAQSEIAQLAVPASQTHNPSPAARVFDIGQQLRWSMGGHGFIVLGEYIRKEHCRKTCGIIDSHNAKTLLSMGYPKESKNGPGGMLEVPHQAWWKTPLEWDGKPFGVQKRLGYNRILGGGPICSSKSFRAKEELVQVQNAVRGVNEQLYQACCERVEEGAGLKLCGQTDYWKNHLDINRLGTYQNLIALTDAVVAIYPKSHTLPWPTSGHFYELQTVDMKNLAGRGIALTEIQMHAGDVLIMEGGVWCIRSQACQQMRETDT